MLVLSRKPGESIRIGNGITVTINNVKGNRVSLAIAAPDDVKILRGELQPTTAAGAGAEGERQTNANANAKGERDET